MRSLERSGTTLRVGSFASLRTTQSRRLSLPPFEGRIADAFDAPEVLALLAEPEMLFGRPGAEALPAGRNRIVAAKVACGPSGTADIVVKEFRLRGIDALKSAVLPSKAAKAWRGAGFLGDAGFETPAPVAFLEKRKGGFVEWSYFVAERIRDGGEIRDLFRGLPDDLLRPLLAALAKTLARLHDKGILHRDLSDGNILVKEMSGAFRFIFLDTNRVRRRRRLGAAARAKNLIRLGVPPAHRLFFLDAYAAAGNRPLSRTFVFWYALNKKVFSGWVRFKKALRLKTISRKLKIQ